MSSWGSEGRRGVEGKNVGEPRGEEERRGEEPRGEEPSTLPLSGTSSAFFLRPGAGLVPLTPGGAAGSKVLPKLPGAGSTGQFIFFLSYLKLFYQESPIQIKNQKKNQRDYRAHRAELFSYSLETTVSSVQWPHLKRTQS